MIDVAVTSLGIDVVSEEARVRAVKVKDFEAWREERMWEPMLPVAFGGVSHEEGGGEGERWGLTPTMAILLKRVEAIVAGN